MCRIVRANDGHGQVSDALRTTCMRPLQESQLFLRFVEPIDISWLYLALVFLVDRFRTSCTALLFHDLKLSCNIDFFILPIVRYTIS